MKSLGISLMSEWDVLAFVSSRKASLITADGIASLIGYETTAVSAALDHLEDENLIERSELSQGVSLYRILTLRDVTRQACLLQLISLSKTRAGRILLAKELKSVSRDRHEKGLSLKREGKWLCLKAI